MPVSLQTISPLYNTIIYNAILRTSIAPVSSAWPSSKALQPKVVRQKRYTQRKAIFVIKRSRGQLTKEDTLDQRGAFLDVAENKPWQGFGRANTPGKFLPDRRCTNAENSSSGLIIYIQFCTQEQIREGLC